MLILYSTITTDDTWKFSLFNREAKEVEKDINTDAVPTDLAHELSILLGITMSPLNQVASSDLVTDFPPYS
ncbi:MAG: hypothetical protein AAGH78_05935 [Cyanobacteria bacterium P01_H01_bin.58]